jgi:CRP-like cAMP-binding protein
MAVLAQRVRNLSELVEDTLFLNLPVRLAKKVVAYAQIHGQRTPEGVRIALKLSQEEWGDLVGATRESINKQMRAWSDQGLIRVDHGHLVILRPEALEALAGSPIV